MEGMFILYRYLLPIEVSVCGRILHHLSPRCAMAERSLGLGICSMKLEIVRSILRVHHLLSGFRELVSSVPSLSPSSFLSLFLDSKIFLGSFVHCTVSTCASMR